MARPAARCTPGTSQCMFDAVEPGTERVELRTGPPGGGPSSGVPPKWCCGPEVAQDHLRAALGTPNPRTSRLNVTRSRVASGFW